MIHFSESTWLYSWNKPWQWTVLAVHNVKKRNIRDINNTITLPVIEEMSSYCNWTASVLTIHQHIRHIPVVLPDHLVEYFTEERPIVLDGYIVYYQWEVWTDIVKSVIIPWSKFAPLIVVVFVYDQSLSGLRCESLAPCDGVDFSLDSTWQHAPVSPQEFCLAVRVYEHFRWGSYKSSEQKRSPW